VTVRGSLQIADDIYVIFSREGRQRLIGRFEIDGHVIVMPGETLVVSRESYRAVLRHRTMPASGGVVFSISRDGKRLAG